MSERGVRGVSAFALTSGTMLAVAVIGLVLFDARYHEFWRDEAQTMLLGGSVPLHRLLAACRADGHPPLFDLVSLPFAGILSPVHRLLLTGAIGFAMLLVGTYRCILSICCDRWASLVLTALLACTHTFAYELGVVIRIYGMGAGLALLTSAYLREALRGHSLRPVLLGTLSGSLCLVTSAHASTIAGASFLSFGLLSLWRHRGVKLVLPTLAALPFLAVLASVMLPFPGREGGSNVDLKLPWKEFSKMALQALRASFTPQDWWVTAAFGKPDTLDLIARLRHWGQAGILLASAYCVVILCTRGYRHYRLLLAYDLIGLVVAWAALSVILVDHYWGSPRHHVFLGLPLVVMVAGWGAMQGLGGLRLATAPAIALLLPWLAYQDWVCARCLLLDVDMPFSDTKAAARLLAPGAHLVAESVVLQEGYMLWRPDIVMRGQDQGGRRLGYQANDNIVHANVAPAPLVRSECTEAPDRTYYSGWRWGLGGASSCLRMVREASPHSEQTRPDERFDLYQVDCACMARTN